MVEDLLGRPLSQDVIAAGVDRLDESADFSPSANPGASGQQQSHQTCGD